MWNLYETQPIKLMHPIGIVVPVAAVSPIKNGIVYWSANYLIAAAMSGMLGGSGFPYYPLEGVKPEWSEQDQGWKITDGENGIYLFLEPDEQMLEQWEKYKKYVQLIEELHKEAAESYGEPE